MKIGFRLHLNTVIPLLDTSRYLRKYLDLGNFPNLLFEGLPTCPQLSGFLLFK